MVEAEAYFLGKNPAIDKTLSWKNSRTGNTITVKNTIVKSNYFYRFLLQVNQFLLTNGVQLETEAIKAKLGVGFDKTFEAAGESTLIFGVAWLFKDLDKIQLFTALEFIPLFDRRTGEIKAGVRFGRLDSDNPMWVELYELDGITEYEEQTNVNGKVTVGKLVETVPKRSYFAEVTTYAVNENLTEETPIQKYKSFPVIPFYANNYHRSTLTEPVKTKIDMFDQVFSNFGDDLLRATFVYWMLNGVNGTKEEIMDMLADIHELHATYSPDGGGASAVPHTIDVPYAARQTALDILRKELYADYMAMDLDQITGGSLTNVAIDTAKFNLSLTCSKFENEAFSAVQKLLKLEDIETENIRFKKQSISNETEITTNIISLYEANILDLQTALEKLPMVDQDEVQVILDRIALAELGVPTDDAELDEEEPPINEV